jgi:hypothetical protein
MANKTFTVQLNDELQEMLQECMDTREKFGKNEAQIVQQAFQLGLKQLHYRTTVNNPRKIATDKELREEFKKLGGAKAVLALAKAQQVTKMINGAEQKVTVIPPVTSKK